MLHNPVRTETKTSLSFQFIELIITALITFAGIFITLVLILFKDLSEFLFSEPQAYDQPQFRGEETKEFK
jgi:hypothetical protein